MTESDIIKAADSFQERACRLYFRQTLHSFPVGWNHPFLLFHLIHSLRLTDTVNRGGNARVVENDKNDKNRVCRYADSLLAEEFNCAGDFHIFPLALFIKGLKLKTGSVFGTAFKTWSASQPILSKSVVKQGKTYKTEIDNYTDKSFGEDFYLFPGCHFSLQAEFFYR